MRFARSFLLPAALAACLIASGCASVSLPGPAMPRAAPFELLGRVLVSHEGRAFSSHVRWHHSEDTDEIWLMTPTGQALAHLQQGGDGAVITGADQTQYRAARLESLTRRALGWDLPMAPLQYWVRGAPAPALKDEANADIRERDDAGRILQLAQDGWRISYEHYPPDRYQGLPRRLEMVGAAQTIRLVIDTWRGDEERATVSPGAK